MLNALNQIVQDIPLLIVGSYRHDERATLPQDLPDMQVLHLSRLNYAEMAELSESILGEAGRQTEILHFLSRETEGNAFFLVEVVRALAEEVGRLREIGHMALPEHVVAGGVQEVIQRRLNQIPAEAQNLLQAAALAGRELDLQLLQHIGGSETLEDWLNTCANSAVLELNDGIWRFTHDKLRQSIFSKWQTRREPHCIAESPKRLRRSIPMRQNRRRFSSSTGMVPEMMRKNFVMPEWPVNTVCVSVRWKKPFHHLSGRCNWLRAPPAMMNSAQISKPI